MTNLTAPEPFACAMVIITAMSAAGFAHTLWMRSGLARAFKFPIDGGVRLRGRRLFGDNKTVAGFVVIVPAAGIAFALLGGMREILPVWPEAGLWALGLAELFALGAWAGLWFMAGELPNSFIKRQLGIAPGTVPAQGVWRLIVLLLDRIDSIFALMLALSMVVPISALTWFFVFTLGPVVHLGFSAMLYMVGVKARIA
jgi:CDP-2,3-bis-(O-geranylgeranyl)-sn-glycerol synthase